MVCMPITAKNPMVAQHAPVSANFHQTRTTGPRSVVNPQSTTAAAAAGGGGGVSTGLRLAFENDRLRSTSPVSTSGRPEVTAKNLVASMADDFSSHLQKERDEIEHLLKIQVHIWMHFKLQYKRVSILTSNQPRSPKERVCLLMLSCSGGAVLPLCRQVS